MHTGLPAAPLRQTPSAIRDDRFTRCPFPAATTDAPVAPVISSNTAMEHQNRCTDLRHPELLAACCPYSSVHGKLVVQHPSRTKEVEKLPPLRSFSFLTADFMVWRHSASDRRMDRESDHGSLRLGTSSPLIRDRDGAYGEVFIRTLRSMGIRDRPTSPRSLWQNGYAERLIGSIRRECLDHVIVCSERHLRHLLLCYIKYYNGARTHLSLEKDAPVSRAVDRARHILC